MNRRLCVSLFVVVLLFAAARQRAHAQFNYPHVRYDVPTGNVKFMMVPPIFAIRLFSSESLLIPDVGNNMGFQLTEKTASLYSWLASTRISAPVLDAGNIVQPVEYSRRFHLIADYVATFPGIIKPMPIVYVPEPPTLLLAVASFVMLGAYRLSRGRR